jgi:hypothetical protein
VTCKNTISSSLVIILAIDFNCLALRFVDCVLFILVDFVFLFVLELSAVGKVYKGFRFDPELYAGFKRLASSGGCTVTGAFERFMNVCVERGVLVFPEREVAGSEAEARVLVDWLEKGKRFYRGEGGEEVNIAGRLVWLLAKVRSVELRSSMEEQLKRSVPEQGDRAKS